MTTPARRRFWETQKKVITDNAAPAMMTGRMLVTGISYGANGAPEYAIGQINGKSGFRVSIRGHAVREQDVIVFQQPKGNPIDGELMFDSIDYSSRAGSGLVTSNANLPAPTFADPAYIITPTTAPGTMVSQLTVFFHQISGTYDVSGYTISSRYTLAGSLTFSAWRDDYVSHIAGQPIGQYNVGNFPSGSTVQVKLRGRYFQNSQESAESVTVLFEIPVDNTPATNGSVLLTVDGSIPGMVTLRPSIPPGVTFDPDRFRAWRFEIADTAGDTSPQILEATDALSIALPPEDYFFSVRSVSKVGTLGPRTPVVGFQGPYVVTGLEAGDTTAPPVPDPPTVTGLVWIGADYVARAKIRLTLAPYIKPDDFADYVLNVANLDTGLQWPQIVLTEIPLVVTTTRVTETGDRRVTEAGDPRITE